jgi:hypothetical protein
VQQQDELGTVNLGMAGVSLTDQAPGLADLGLGEARLVRRR